MIFPDDIFKEIISYCKPVYKIPSHYVSFIADEIVCYYMYEREFYEKFASPKILPNWFAYNSFMRYKYWWLTWH